MESNQFSCGVPQKSSPSVQASTILVKPQYSSPAHHYSAVPLCVWTIDQKRRSIEVVVLLFSVLQVHRNELEKQEPYAPLYNSIQRLDHKHRHAQ